MTWQEICDDPTFQDLPYKIETNEYGQVVMSPASNQHGRQQSRIVVLLSQLTSEGEVITECSVNTEKGTKVADVAWLSSDFVRRHALTTPYPEAPEICVEIRSPSNSESELEDKMRLYFNRGAREVLVCDSFGNVDFHGPLGELAASALVSDFPERI